MTSLSSRDRVLYARHLLLAEIGEAGQARLAEASVTVSGDDDETRAACADALTRAGVRVVSEGATARADVGNASELEVLADKPELREAARALRGAFAAVETIKALTGVGQAAPFPEGLKLSAEDL